MSPKKNVINLHSVFFSNAPRMKGNVVTNVQPPSALMEERAKEAEPEGEDPGVVSGLDPVELSVPVEPATEDVKSGSDAAEDNDQIKEQVAGDSKSSGYFVRTFMILASRKVAEDKDGVEEASHGPDPQICYIVPNTKTAFPKASMKLLVGTSSVAALMCLLWRVSTASTLGASGSARQPSRPAWPISLPVLWTTCTWTTMNAVHDSARATHMRSHDLPLHDLPLSKRMNLESCEKK